MKKTITLVCLLLFAIAVFAQAPAPQASVSPPGDSLTADENKRLDILAEIFRRQREERDDLVARYKVVSDQLAKTQKELEDFAKQALDTRGLKSDSGATVDLGARKVVRPAGKPEDRGSRIEDSKNQKGK